MRVEIRDWNGQPYFITSRDPELIGKWFGEHATHLMSANTALDVSIHIWPQDQTEFDMLGGLTELSSPLTQDGLLKLAEVILDASKKLGDLEAKAGR